ncbi:MAG: DNA-binding protein [Candidatus Syntrophonatronum acetioxidans]|uniref:DNA-binding protein n=1 Tax=Candidatus Syntrophonatronum acetioxidans TaxID=1795816 RepID=A0A424YHP1_9FIRM|nr:MAG: DNA-binding protein [Candidatus Syntrophonatronum acetioxidans]
MKNSKNYEELPMSLTVNQVASLWGVSPKVAYRTVKDKGLAIKVGEKRLIIPREKFVRFMEGQL